ncbi:MAG TPA: isocitrate/isopropylmalate family dehydrogenase, partial [Actinomycetota bacterium]|nr:isocitrate/isopropylmalate family dehydrogenase [Actinomycetota bacterium]
MDTKTVVVIPGDGIGPEIWAASRPVLECALAESGEGRFVWEEWPAGQIGIEQSGSPLPKETLDAIDRHRVAFKGPLTTPVGTGFRSVNVALRVHFNLYANIRPIRCLPGVQTPVHSPEKVDIVLFRENTEDVYAGFELEAGTPEALEMAAFCKERFGWPIPPDAGLGLKPISASASKRLVRAALRYAIAHGRDSVTLVHKGNIQKFTEGRFRTWGYEVVRDEFADTTGIEGAEDLNGRIAVRDLLADAFLQEILIRPERFAVVATTNLNGDYAADALAAQVGGVGVVPGANINEEEGRAVFEQTHGTAPSIAGQDIANPVAMVLSGAMMLDFFEWTDAATRVRAAVASVVGGGVGTEDLGLA